MDLWEKVYIKNAKTISKKKKSQSYVCCFDEN